ncbi:MAG: hypothetical protein FJ102_00410 [Deltaproteobacteria bacterium]|nr:hypothetical protein [Deltaproteobacteria bacterium]
MFPYHDFLPPTLLDALHGAAEPVPGVDGLRVAPGLQSEFPRLQNADVLALVVSVYNEVAAELAAVLRQRELDRAFVDAGTLELVAANAGIAIESPAYRTVIGERDARSRVVVGPGPGVALPAPVTVPAALQGPQVTLFGPPDSARMAINAMNALHRVRPGEPAIVAELVDSSGAVPRWGADSEDSKTPLARDLLAASENLARCIDGTLEVRDGARHYTLAPHQRSIPIKRVAGLALPDGSHLFNREPLPLHLVELVQHAALNRDRPEALVYYIPKLENEEEAAYLASLLACTERHLGLPAGTIRVLLVFENPRAIFRIREMATALHPWFLGGSLGWHDFLASTARLFKNDPGYRIPVKADPNIVIRNIRESHRILVRDLGPMGALKIGGMYGVLPTEGDPASYAVSIVGFVRDVTTQLKRGLDGYWVAHPDFVRIGIALVEAWRQGPAMVDALVRALVPAEEVDRCLAFVHAPDPPGLDEADPRYPRAVLAAERGASEVIANDHPDEVRYNLFQALQYLCDWLAGRGCVALPATMKDASGQPVFVRVMDDLATTERSRWELWAEVHHGRVPVATLDRLLAEELAFIREGRSTDTKRTQVAWHPTWSPIAARLLRAMVVTEDPPEFVTQLLLPFAQPMIRDAADPWARARRLCPGLYDWMEIPV